MNGWYNSFFPFFQPINTSKKKIAKYKNDLEFQNTFMLLFNTMLTTFKWNGLPETCNVRFFEANLILHGKACLALDDLYGYVTLKCSATGENRNIYGESSKIFAYGWNGFHKTYTNYMYGSDNTEAQAVICKDNPVQYPFSSYLIMICNRLADTMRTLDVASKKLKVPYFITCDESQKASVEAILNEVEDNYKHLITSKQINPDAFKVIPTQIDTRIIDTLWTNYDNYNAWIREILGINSLVNGQKKERLITAEADSNNEQANINIEIRLRERRKFCEIANKMFGLNLSVEINPAFIPEKENETPEVKEDSDNDMD